MRHGVGAVAIVDGRWGWCEDALLPLGAPGEVDAQQDGDGDGDGQDEEAEAHERARSHGDVTSSGLPTDEV